MEDPQERLALEAQVLALSTLANCVEDDKARARRLAQVTVGHLGGCDYLAARLAASTAQFRAELDRDAAACAAGADDAAAALDWRAADLVFAAHLAFPLACIATADDPDCRAWARAALAQAGASLRFLARVLESFVALASLNGPGALTPEVLKTSVFLVAELRRLGDHPSEPRGDADAGPGDAPPRDDGPLHLAAPAEEPDRASPSGGSDDDGASSAASGSH